MAKPLDDRPIALVPRMLVEHLVPGRECGECVACCKILEIDKPELKKPADVLCTHCTGAGCGIYATRPDVCRTWHCLWRRMDATPDFIRPDKLGVVFSLGQYDPPRVIFERVYVIARAISSPTVFETDAVKAALNMFAEEGSLPVWAGFNGEKILYYPTEPFASAIVDPSKAESRSLAEKALAWRKRYAVD
jgi:Fe-S-cluster containining protein